MRFWEIKSINIHETEYNCFLYIYIYLVLYLISVLENQSFAATLNTRI